MESPLSDTEPAQVVSTEVPAGSVNANYGASDPIVSNDVSLALSDGCVIYRKVTSNRTVVKFIALRSIKSCCIQFRKRKAILIAALALLSMAAAMVWWMPHLPHGGRVFHLYRVVLPTITQQRMAWISLQLSITGIVFLIAYLTCRRIELVISTSSGENPVRIPLSTEVKGSIQLFIAHIMVEIRKIRSWSRISSSH